MLKKFKQNPGSKAYLALLFISFIFYGNTIVNEYALDDAIVITDNHFTQQGFSGIDDILLNDSFTGFFGQQKKLVSGGRFRPLSIITYAVEYELFGENPHVSHFNNVLLLALTGMLIFSLFRKLFWHYHKRPWFLSISFLTALLFIVHPIHTEAVANIKGRDEMMSLFFALLALHEAIRFTFKKRIGYLVLVFLFFFLALLSKENAITFLAIIPLTLYFFREKLSGDGYRKIIVPVIPALIATGVYLGMRYYVLGFFSTEPPNELMNNPFLHATASEKYGTIFYTLGLYLKLLFLPHPLTFDYYPYHIALVEFTHIKSLLSLGVYLMLILVAFYYLRSKTVISYCIFYYILTLSIVTNIFFPVGTFLNERFLYMPSLGFSIFLAYLISHYLYRAFKPEHLRPVMISVFVAGILIFSGFKIIRRNQDWKNNFTLFTNDVLISENSAKSNTSAGGIYMEHALESNDPDQQEAYYSKAIEHLRKALKIYPEYTDALLLLGNTFYHYQGNIDSTLFYYEKILARAPDYERVYLNMRAMVEASDLNIDKKMKICKAALEHKPNHYFFNYRLGKYYGQHRDNISEGIHYLEKAVSARPNSIEALKDLGVSYGLQREFVKSREIFERALELDPDDPQLYINQGINYRQMGNVTQASYYFQKARELQRKQDDKQ